MTGLLPSTQPYMYNQHPAASIGQPYFQSAPYRLDSEHTTSPQGQSDMQRQYMRHTIGTYPEYNSRVQHSRHIVHMPSPMCAPTHITRIIQQDMIVQQGMPQYHPQLRQAVYQHEQYEDQDKSQHQQYEDHSVMPYSDGQSISVRGQNLQGHSQSPMFQVRRQTVEHFQGQMPGQEQRQYPSQLYDWNHQQQP